MEIPESCDSTIKLVEFCSWRGVVGPPSPPRPLSPFRQFRSYLRGLIRLIYTHPPPKIVRGLRPLEPATLPSPESAFDPRELARREGRSPALARPPLGSALRFRRLVAPDARQLRYYRERGPLPPDLSARIKYSPPRRADLTGPTKRFVFPGSLVVGGGCRVEGRGWREEGGGHEPRKRSPTTRDRGESIGLTLFLSLKLPLRCDV
jgi:hypothetical protein